MRDTLINSIAENEAEFGLELNSDARERLAAHFELVLANNRLLHLVAPCPPAEIATRHILESLTVLRHLPKESAFVDVGSGGGFPAIPCLLVREDLKARLIESKAKKANFLDHAIGQLGLTSRAEVVEKQFTETSPGEPEFVMCRALDKFSERLSKLVKWAGSRQMLLFGGEHLGQQLSRTGVVFVQELMPFSERRFLFITSRPGAA